MSILHMRQKKANPIGRNFAQPTCAFAYYSSIYLFITTKTELWTFTLLSSHHRPLTALPFGLSLGLPLIIKCNKYIHVLNGLNTWVYDVIRHRLHLVCHPLFDLPGHMNHAWRCKHSFPETRDDHIGFIEEMLADLKFSTSAHWII